MFINCSIIPTSVHIQPKKNENVSRKRFSMFDNTTTTTTDDAQSDTAPLIENK